MRNSNLLLIFSYITIFILCLLGNVENQDTSALSKAIDQFAAKLYGKSPNKNYFISPCSMWMALSMCFVGARGNTGKELSELLAYGSTKPTEIYKQINRYMKDVIQATNGGYTLNLANRVFAKKMQLELNKLYTDILAQYFGVEIQALTFVNATAAANTINQWVSLKTNNKINNILDPSMIRPHTKMVIVNTLYFKADWFTKFLVSNTFNSTFTTPDKSVVQVSMMKNLGKMFNCWVNMTSYDNATACEIPYASKKSAMTIILPSRNSSLSNLEKKLDLNSLVDILNHTKNSTKIDFYLPKFTIKYKEEMKGVFESLGALTPFSENADFTGITTSTRLSISNVIHQTYVSVSEFGTEASAGTVVNLIGATKTKPVEFMCDRPFIFIIHDLTTRAILFIGKLTNPLNN